MTAANLKKVLFISHEASRSGAPIVLLHLLKWIKANTPLQFDILLLNDGTLKPDFEALGKTYIASDIFNGFSTINRIKRKLFNIAPDKTTAITAIIGGNNYDLVYGNTILSLPLLSSFKTRYGTKTVCCIHELSYALNYCFDHEYLVENLPSVDKIIAVSKAVKHNLIDSYNLNEEQVELQYEFIDTGNKPTTLSTDSSIKQDNAFIIGAGGTPEWRKGTDLVIPLALNLVEQYPKFKFKIAWLGADVNCDYVKNILYDARKCGIADKLLFIAPSSKPLDVINQFDVFALLSREDPFPLIALEAAFLQKPIVAFSNSGGIPELLDEGAGLLAPYLDIAKMSSNIYLLSNNKQSYETTGSKAQELILTKYNSNVIPPNIYDIINNLMA
ncbi:MAG: glycosyltransferase family 4 protein [Bacteroidota bacterium]